MFRYRLMQFMQGRNGFDSLNFVLLIASMAVSLTASILRWFIPFATLQLVLVVISYALLAWAIFRFLSRNLDARRRENDKYLQFVSKFRKKSNSGTYGGYKGYSNGYDTSFYEQPKNQYKYFKCKKCKAKLRVPLGKGKITITCPKCRSTFKGRS